VGKNNVDGGWATGCDYKKVERGCKYRVEYEYKLDK
jgi:hypothetical protein